MTAASVGVCLNCPARPSLAPPTPVTPDVGSDRAPEPRQDAADRPKRPTVPTEQAVSQIEAIERAYPPVVRNPTGHPRYQYRTGGKPDASTRFDGHFDCPASGTSTRSIAARIHVATRRRDRPILGYVLLLGFPSVRDCFRAECRACRPHPTDPAAGSSGGYPSPARHRAARIIGPIHPRLFAPAPRGDAQVAGGGPAVAPKRDRTGRARHRHRDW